MTRKIVHLGAEDAPVPHRRIIIDDQSNEVGVSKPHASDHEVGASHEDEGDAPEEIDETPLVPGPSLRKAINGMCKACVYDPYARGTWRYQVDMCPSKSCPLHGVRPRSKYQSVERVE